MLHMMLVDIVHVYWLKLLDQEMYTINKQKHTRR